MFRRIGSRSRIFFASLGVLALLSGFLLLPVAAGAQESAIAPEGFPHRSDPERCVALQDREFPLFEIFLDRIVEAGIVSQEQADMILGEFMDAAQERCFGRLILSPRDAAEVTAEVTDSEVRDVWFALRGGDSLASYAADNGVSQDELVAALMTEASGNADELVAGGYLSEDEANDLLERIEDRVLELIDKVPEPRHRF